MERNHQKLRSADETEGNVLDHALDVALAKYSAIEPRPGLERRIVANLRSAQDAVPARSWWQWSAVSVMAMLLVVAAAAAWKLSRPAERVVQHPAAPMPRSAQVATNTETPLPVQRYPLQRRRAQRHSAAQHDLASDGPKLDQFPSPEPLTQEELALIRYVRRFPSDAVMIASTQEEFEKEIQQEGAARGEAIPNSTEEER